MSVQINHTSGIFRSYDGTAIFYRSWQPGNGHQAMILLLHGLGEHTGRYQGMAEYFVPRRYAILAMDLRGHGKSGGKRGCVRRFNDYIRDLHRFRCYFSKTFEGKPLFIIGHSLGGLIAFLYALDHGEGLSGVVLLSPLFGLRLKVPQYKQLLGKTLSLLLPRLCLNNEVIPAHLCRDEKVVDDYINDPLVHDRASTRYFTEMLAAMRKSRESAADVKVPLFFALAGNDLIISVPACREIYENINAPHSKLITYEAFYHELYNEPERACVFSDIEGWLTARVS